MKFLLLIIATTALTSCNTSIGLGRDIKQGFEWTKSKFQGAQQEEAAGAPVY